MREFYGSIEAGGTKWVCAVGSSPDKVEDTTVIATTTPDETIPLVIEYFRSHNERRSLTAIGIGSFGPLDLDQGSPTYGCIQATPKPDWENTDLLGKFRNELGRPVALETDANVAALGEQQLGAAKGLSDCIYLTIGTGIGGGIIANGELINGFCHPEMGHIRIPRGQGDSFSGICPFHGDCLEGLASGPAIEQRWGVPGEMLGPEHPAWVLQAEYIASALTNYIFTLAPQRIILGGGVMRQKQLLPLIRESVQRMLSSYFPAIASRTEDYIVGPRLGDQAGICGALELARRLARKQLSS